MKTTLNQCVNKVKELCAKHPMIKDYAFGQSLMEVDTSQIQTPYFYITPDPSTLQSGGLQINLIFTCFDQMSEDFSNEQEVLSDTLQIIQDVITYLDQSNSIDFQVNLDNNFTVNPFTHRFDSLVAGWYCVVQLQLSYPGGLCDNPIAPDIEDSDIWIYNFTVTSNSPNYEKSASKVPADTLKLYAHGSYPDGATFEWTDPTGTKYYEKDPTMTATSSAHGEWTLKIKKGSISRTLTTNVKIAK